MQRLMRIPKDKLFEKFRQADLLSGQDCPEFGGYERVQHQGAWKERYLLIDGLALRSPAAPSRRCGWRNTSSVIPVGEFSCALVAGPLSSENPWIPSPTTVTGVSQMPGSSMQTGGEATERISHGFVMARCIHSATAEQSCRYIRHWRKRNRSHN